MKANIQKNAFSPIAYHPPGVWEDEHGMLHFDLAKMCLANGWEPNEENQERLGLVIAEEFKALGAQPEVIFAYD